MSKPDAPEKPDPFKELTQLMGELSVTYSAIRSKKAFPDRYVQNIINAIRYLASSCPDESLASIHLSKETSPLKQPLFTALLAELVATRLNYDETARNKLLSAALLANISFIEFQVLLNSMDKELSEEQMQKQRQHPEESAAMLEAGGIDDPHILTVVRQHHEKLDGSGYPNKLSGADIEVDALLIQLCDFYSAMIDHRAYRSPMHAREALHELYKNCNVREKPLHVALIKTIGIYPPGTFVKLKNGETAMVVKRNPKGVMPKVKALFEPNNKPYLGGLLRDCDQAQYEVASACSLPGRPSVDLRQLFD